MRSGALRPQVSPHLAKLNPISRKIRLLHPAESQDGWVHAPLVTAVAPAAPSADPKFSEFRHAVITLNASAKEQVGENYFDHIENLGDGVVQLRATSTWLWTPRAEQQGNLDALFDMWSVAHGRVRIVDRSGQLVIEKHRD